MKIDYSASQNWRDIFRTRTSPKINETFGEPMEIFASIVKVNFPPCVDWATPYPVRAVFRLRSELVPMASRHDGQMSGSGTIVQSRRPIIEFDAATLPLTLGLGFVVRRCDTGRNYEIRGIEPDGVSRITCTLNELGLQAGAVAAGNPDAGY